MKPMPVWSDADEIAYNQLGKRDYSSEGYVPPSFEASSKSHEGVNPDTLSDAEFDRHYATLGSHDGEFARTDRDASEKASIADSGRLLGAHEQNLRRPINTIHAPTLITSSHGTQGDRWNAQTARQAEEDNAAKNAPPPKPRYPEGAFRALLQSIDNGDE
jgi:hypothetical protein